MSSILLSPKHFNSVENGIKKLAISKQFEFCYAIRKGYYSKIDRRHYSLETVEKTVSEIMDEIRKLSVLSYHLQYKHDYIGTLDKEIQEWNFILLNDKLISIELTNIQLYSALNCIAYQIEIDHLEELRPLTSNEQNVIAFLELFKTDLLEHIVRNTQEYKDSKWTID